MVSTCAVWSLYTSHISLKLNRQIYLYSHSLLIISLNTRPLLIPRSLCACCRARHGSLIRLVFPQCAAVARLDPVYTYKHEQARTRLSVETAPAQQGATKTHWALGSDLPLAWVCILCAWSVQQYGTTRSLTWADVNMPCMNSIKSGWKTTRTPKVTS